MGGGGGRWNEKFPTRKARDTAEQATVVAKIVVVGCNVCIEHAWGSGGKRVLDRRGSDIGRLAHLAVKHVRTGQFGDVGPQCDLLDAHRALEYAACRGGRAAAAGRRLTRAKRLEQLQQRSS
jgi:hypothetical protein